MNRRASSAIREKIQEKLDEIWGNVVETVGPSVINTRLDYFHTAITTPVVEHIVCVSKAELEGLIAASNTMAYALAQDFHLRMREHVKWNQEINPLLEEYSLGAGSKLYISTIISNIKKPRQISSSVVETQPTTLPDFYNELTQADKRLLKEMYIRSIDIPTI